MRHLAGNFQNRHPMNHYYYAISIFFVTAPLVVKYSKSTVPAILIIAVSLVAILIRTIILAKKSSKKKKLSSSWVKSEDFDKLEAQLLNEMPAHREVISQVITSIKQFSKKNIFKNYLGFNFLLGEENQGKKDVSFSLLNHCRSDIQVKVFYGGLCNSSNVKSYFEDLYHFIQSSGNPVVIFVDIEKLPEMALEILIDSLSRGLIEHSKEVPASLQNTLFFALVDVSENEYSAAGTNLEQVLKNKNLPSSLISKNTLLTYIRSFKMNEIAEQILFELSKIWEKNGITLNNVAPEVIYDLLLKMKEHENSNIEYIRNWILRNHVKYIEKVKERKIKNVNLFHSEDGKLKVKMLKVAKS